MDLRAWLGALEVGRANRQRYCGLYDLEWATGHNARKPARLDQQ